MQKEEHNDSTNAFAPSAQSNIAMRFKKTAGRHAFIFNHAANIQSREIAITARENAVDSREQALLQREKAVDIRETELSTRESVIISCEQKMHTLLITQAALEEKMRMLRTANEHLVIASIEAQSLTEQIKLAKTDIDHMAHHDVLTDLPNRLLLKTRLNQAIELAQRQGTQAAVIFMDLDRFKHINDSLGHSIGDQLLQSVSQRLRDCVRHSDTVSRQGGDEFLVLLHVIEHAEDAALLAKKILAALGPTHHIDQHELHISVSIGISIYPEDGADAETLIKNADTAMYHAKENGRNNYKFFDHSMNASAVKRQSIEADLRRALQRQELVLYYQPKINLRSGNIVGVEALIRWKHPERGLVLPEEFISIAEDSGLILCIGRWALHDACMQAAAWRNAGFHSISVAVNASALEFRTGDFIDKVRAILDETGLEAGYLEIELTESILMRHAESTIDVLQALTDLGVKLAVDDFGTGYSSLSYLQQFPIDTLKIDQSFVNQITRNPEGATLVSAVIGIGNCLNQRVIAEGVETLEQYAYLRAQDCDEAQGNYFFPPMTAEAFTRILENRKPLP